MQTFLVGSTYFFNGLKGFNSKDIDHIILIENPVGFKNTRQTSGLGSCLFEWRKMTADEFVEFTLNSKVSMSAIKFLSKEFNEEIGFTINHLKKLGPVFNRMDYKHQYSKIIFDAYILNNSFELTDSQRLAAYKEYKKERSL